MSNKNLLIAVFSLSFGEGNAQNYQQATQCSLSLTISSGNVTCFGLNDGFASITPVNGIPPYTYLWSSGGTNSSITALAPSVYFITVYDSSGCTITDSIAVTEPFPLNSFFDSIENVSCNYPNTAELCFLPYYCDGHATGTVSGGTPPYLYSWVDLLCGTWLCNYQWAGNNLWGCASIYKFTVTDSNGCMLMDTIAITGPPKLSKTVNTVSAICSTCVGSASVQLSGGSPPYNFYWDNNPSIISISSVDSTSSITALPGTYSVDIMRAGECTLCTSVTIGWAEQCWKLTADIYIMEDTVVYNVSGTPVSFTFNGANAANYLWDFGDGNTSIVQNPVHIYSTTGIYSVMLIATNGYCSDTVYATITILDVGIKKSGCNSGSCVEKFKIQPNPASNNLTITTTIGDEIFITDIMGRKIKEYKLFNNQLKINTDGFNNGIYFLTLYNNLQLVAAEKLILAK